MAETTSSEFVEWQEFFRNELAEPTREEYYLAQIAAEVRRTIAKRPGAVSLSSFLLKFKPMGEAERAPADIEYRIALSKAKWFGIANANAKQWRKG